MTLEFRANTILVDVSELVDITAGSHYFCTAKDSLNGDQINQRSGGGGNLDPNLKLLYESICLDNLDMTFQKKFCVSFPFFLCFILQQGLDGSARKPALVQDTDYMVEKPYHIAPYLGDFGDYLMPQRPINGSKYIFKFYETETFKNMFKIVQIPASPQPLQVVTPGTGVGRTTLLGPTDGLVYHKQTEKNEDSFVFCFV